MSQPLRSLSGLLDFEAAARWGSVKLAAVELHKTAAAVSLQVKQLEQNLGFALFVRHPRHIALTAKGQELAATVSQCVAGLRAKVAALQDDNGEAVLRVSATHSFALKWLVPRLSRFTAMHPELDVRLDASDAPVDLTDHETDIAFRHVPYAAADAMTDAAPDSASVFADPLVVVYSPSLLPKGRKALRLADLPSLPLLFEGNTEDWIALLRANKMLRQSFNFARRYSHSGLLTQAAVAGHGVALAPYLIAHGDIASGLLRVLPCHGLPASEAYRLLCNPNKAGMAKIRLFSAWVAAEMAALGHQAPG